MSTETMKADVPAQQFQPGQRVKYGEFEATIIRHYYEGMWEIRLPGGGACVPGVNLIPVGGAA